MKYEESTIQYLSVLVILLLKILFDQDAFNLEFWALLDTKLLPIRMNEDITALFRYIPIGDTTLAEHVNLSHSNLDKQADVLVKDKLDYP